MGENKIFGIEEEYFNNALKSVSGLYEIPRTGWVNRGVENPETVGQHTEALIDMAKRVCEINKDLDQKKLERMLQIHDWAENDTGDIVTAEYEGEERKKKEIAKYEKEIKALEKICSKLGIEGEVILSLWKEFEEGKTPEASIAKQLDKLQAMLKAWEYQKEGQLVVAQDFINHDRQKIKDPLLLEWLEDLEKEINR